MTDTEKGKVKDGGETHLKPDTKAKVEAAHSKKATLTAKQTKARRTRIIVPNIKATAITVASGATLAETAEKDRQMRQTPQKKPRQTHLSKLPLGTMTKLKRFSTAHSSPTTPTPKMHLQTTNQRQMLAMMIWNAELATPTPKSMRKTMKHAMYSRSSTHRTKTHHCLPLRFEMRQTPFRFSKTPMETLREIQPSKWMKQSATRKTTWNHVQTLTL